MLNKGTNLYNFLSKAEYSLNMTTDSVPVYAIRLLLYLYNNQHRDILSSDILKELQLCQSKLSRIITDYLKPYIDTISLHRDGVKRPVYKYILSRRGSTYVENLIEDFYHDTN